MPYNDVIDRTGAEALISQEVATEIVTAVAETNPIMGMARKLPNMTKNQRRMAVMSALATAYFVTGDISKKSTTDVSWENKYIDAEELAVIVPISEAVLADSDYDIWGEVKPALIQAFNKAIIAALLDGTNIPTSWTTNLGAAGLIARCTAASHTISLAAYTDLYEALLGETDAGTDGLLMRIEADGFMSTGHVAHPSMRGKLRNCRDSEGHPIFKLAGTAGSKFVYELDGAPIAFPVDGSINASTALLITGDWSKLVYAIRQDVTYKLLDQAVIQDAAGAIVYNLAQQDMVALRAVMRLGFALPNPINQMTASATTRCQFAVLTA